MHYIERDWPLEGKALRSQAFPYRLFSWVNVCVQFSLAGVVDTHPSSNFCFLKLAVPGSAHRLKAFAIGSQSSRLIPQPLSYTRPGSPSDNEGLTLLHASRSALVVGWCFLAPAQHMSTHGGKAVTLRKLEDHCLRCCVPGLVPQGTANSFSTSCVHACGSELA